MHLGTTGHPAVAAALQRPRHDVEQWLRAVLTGVPEPPYCTCGPPLVPYAPKAQGSLPRGSTYCTYAVRVPASNVPHVPRTCRGATGYEYEHEPAQHIVPQLETEEPLRTSSNYW